MATILVCEKEKMANRKLHRPKYVAGITTSVLAYESFLTYFKLNNDTIGAMNSTYYGACVIGNVVLWYLPDKIGRIRSIQFACVVNIVAIVLQAAAQNYAMFLVGRIFGGFCSGMIYTVSLPNSMGRKQLFSSNLTMTIRLRVSSPTWEG